MGKHNGTGGLARGKILGRLAFYTWVFSVFGGMHNSILLAAGAHAHQAEHSSQAVMIVVVVAICN